MHYLRGYPNVQAFQKVYNKAEGLIIEYNEELRAWKNQTEQTMKKTIFEEMGGTYIRHGDYLIHCLTLLEEEEQRFIGVWGQRHLRYLKEYRRGIYLNLITSGRLNNYLADIKEQAQELFERIVEQMKQAQGITEQLKADDTLEWIGRMSDIQACAREIVNKEMIYQ